jgi:hypothetical protein
MKTLVHFRRPADHFFHFPPASTMFSVLASFILALLVMLILLAVPSR